MIINFILPISGTFETFDPVVMRVTALIGLLEKGPDFASLILSNYILFYSVKPLFYIAHDFCLNSSGLTEPYLFMTLTGLAL